MLGLGTARDCHHRVTISAPQTPPRPWLLLRQCLGHPGDPQAFQPFGTARPDAPEHLDAVLGPGVHHGIREQFIPEDLPLEHKIPSAEELKRAYGASLSVVRQAVNQLQAEGILEGFTGKGVFVAKVPDSPTAAADLQMAELAALRADVARIEANLVNLFGKLGYEL
jgi:GntR family transcriptional regulator